MPELPTNNPLRRKLSFAIPAVVFLALAAVEPIEMTFFAPTLASLSAEAPIAQGAPDNDPTHCIIPSDIEAARELRQIKI